MDIFLSYSRVSEMFISLKFTSADVRESNYFFPWILHVSSVSFAWNIGRSQLLRTRNMERIKDQREKDYPLL